MDVAGFFFKVDRSKICKWVKKKYLPILEKVLGYACVLPERKISSPEEFMRKLNGLDIFIDGTERMVQRPKLSKLQRKRYSGKKKAHTRKNIIVSDRNKYIHFVSPTKDGKFHDKNISDRACLYDSLKEDIEIWGDKGFQGLANHIKSKVYLPRKPSKKKPLSEEEQQDNSIQASIRIKVEHAIGGMKRFNSISTVFRNKKGIDDKFVEVCAGFWNFHLRYS